MFARKRETASKACLPLAFHQHLTLHTVVIVGARVRRPRRRSAVLSHNMNLDDGARTQSWLLRVVPQQKRLLHDPTDEDGFFQPTTA